MEIQVYDDSNAASIVSYAKKLLNRTLREVINEDVSTQYEVTGSKGRFGNILEEHYFNYKPNSLSEPDFYKAGIELKSSPLKELINGQLVSKERLVMNMINYMDIVNEDFFDGAFYKKNKHLLLIFYLYRADTTLLDYLIKVVDEWKFPDEDLEVIQNDWHSIQNKVAAGLAHELSEGDTLYLGACTKGANKNSIREQPYNKSVMAKQRAYSLKQGYVNHILAKLSDNYDENFGRLFKSQVERKKYSLEEITQLKLSKFTGKSLDEIEQITGFDLNRRSKQYYRMLTNAMLGVDPRKAIEEFEKAGIILKTVRVEDNNRIIESVSFPAFTFDEVYSTEWEDSTLAQVAESRFLFLFLKSSGNKEYYFEKATFWRMPYKDRLEVEHVYQKTQSVIALGKIVRGLSEQKNGKVIYKNNFPKIRGSKVCHVRPHGRNAADTYPLPVADEKTGVNAFTKQSFWLNASYVKSNIYEE